MKQSWRLATMQHAIHVLLAALYSALQGFLSLYVIHQIDWPDFVKFE
jgi:hypothetical protein